MNEIKWALEPDIEELRRSHALIQTDPNQAVICLEKLVERGSTMSMWYLAHLYRTGENIPKDLEKAKYWCVQAKNKGLLHASYMLGDIYYRSQDFESARKAFSDGLSMKYYPSIYRLAKMYQDGIGIEENLVEAGRLFRLGAENKHLLSKRALALMYIKGCFGLLRIPVGIFIFMACIYDIILYAIKTILNIPTSTHFSHPHELL